MKYQAQQFVVYIGVFIILGESCVYFHDCMFTCQRKGAIFKGIFILCVESVSLCFCGKKINK